MIKTGLITYHSAYNYGSALQAFATQKALEDLGIYTEIINYRMYEQKRFYDTYRFSYGLKTFAKDISQFPIHFKRKKRKEAFEKFFRKYLNLSFEVNTPEEVYKIWNMYDTVISGSDQIWSLYSHELKRSGLNYMKPYLLYGFKGKKISYASSAGKMTEKDIKEIAPYIKSFDCVSMREKSTAKLMESIIKKDVKWVLDPTFLLTKGQWRSELSIAPKNSDNSYILFYSLKGITKISRQLKILNAFAQKYNYRIIAITPFAYYPSFGNFENHPEYGPREFLEALSNADMVITDSYHGTILSINFEKEIFSLCSDNGAEFRKTDLLSELGLNDRIIYHIENIAEKKFLPINYFDINNKLNSLRKYSLEYLANSVLK